VAPLLSRCDEDGDEEDDGSDCYVLIEEKQPWGQKHFGTDPLLSAWLFVVGSACYLLYTAGSLCGMVARSAWADVAVGWCEVVAAGFFLFGSVLMVRNAYPESMMEMMSQMAGPPRDLSCIETWCTSSPVLRMTQIFNCGMVPYLVEGALMLARNPTDQAGWTMLLAMVLCMPLLMLWSATAMDFNMRKNNGFGSSYVWDACFAHCCRSRPWLKRHLGTDALVSTWLMVALAVPSQIIMTLTLLFAPTDPAMWYAFFETTCFCGGMVLMHGASYPENFGKSILFSRTDGDER